MKNKPEKKEEEGEVEEEEAFFFSYIYAESHTTRASFNSPKRLLFFSSSLQLSSHGKYFFCWNLLLQRKLEERHKKVHI